jgi:hypothetical protein
VARPPEPEPVFLNLSNHPSKAWSPTQRSAAEALGRIVEPPEPLGEVPIDLDAKALGERVQAIVAQAASLGATTAFVATEFVLTHALVNALQARDIDCVAAVTRRTTLECIESDGSVRRESVFRFEGWRPYLRPGDD